MVVLGLGLFAGPTARNLPGGARLAVVWSLLLSLIAAGLAALVMLALGQPSA